MTERLPNYPKQRRQSIRDSAIGPAIIAVARVRADRHAVRGLSKSETGYAAVVIAWLASGWQPAPVEAAA